jgi:hypothetical protein
MPRRSGNCEIEIFADGRQPAREYLRVARLDVHVETTVWLRPDHDGAIRELKAQGCLAGADAIINVEQLTSRHLENRRLHVIGTAIRWR